jgi:outer membrane scaffolding protein for murein synthesis (MipA/OmpV family)
LLRTTTPVHALIACLTAVLLAVAAPAAWAQTPSPLQEWQYESGVVLANLFEPNLPKWRVIAGPSAQLQPLYDGARSYHLEAGPLIDVRYRNIFFVSVGEGLGVDLLRGTHFRAGASLGYDLGRSVSEDSTHLRGLGDIAPAPVAKLYSSVVLARKFPAVLRVDVRQFIGGADGMVGDLQAYMPLPGSSRTFVMFAGPAITFANHRYLQKEFGVTAAQAAASGYPSFDARAGQNAEGVGFSATWFVTPTWLINVEGALNRLLGSAGDSPIIERRTQRVVTLAVGYMW